MQCACCLSKNKKENKLSAFTASEKNQYAELTRLETKFNSKHKICENCKKLLRASTDFLQLCLKSQEDLLKKEVDTKSKRTCRKKVTKVYEDDHFQECQIDHDEEDSDDDEVLISSLVKQLKHEKDQTVVSISEKPSPVESSPPQKKVKEKKKSLNDIQTKINKFLCTVCGTSFSTSQRLEIHSFTHSGIKNWKCQDCDKVFATKFRLRAHGRIHSGEKPFVCDVCSLGFAQGSALKCHKRIHTKERPFVCKVCSKSFSQNTTLKTHMAALHIGKTVVCDEPGCDKKFTRRSYLLIHKRDHAGERNYICNLCPNQYKQKSHLDRHKEASHLGIRHKCDFPGCNSQFSKSWSLKMHKFVHTPENSLLPYQCQVCGAGFQRRDKLLKHRAKSHPSEKGDLKINSIENPNPNQNQFKTEDSGTIGDQSNYVILSSAPEIYTIQNSDGSFTQVQTLQVIQEK